MSRFALISPPLSLRIPLTTALAELGWTPLLVRVWDQEPLTRSGTLDRVANLGDFQSNVDALNGSSCALLFLDTLDEPVPSIRAILAASDEAGLAHIICVAPDLPVNYLPGGSPGLDLLWFAQQECLRSKTLGAPVTMLPSTRSIDDFSEIWPDLDRFC